MLVLSKTECSSGGGRRIAGLGRARRRRSQDPRWRGRRQGGRDRAPGARRDRLTYEHGLHSLTRRIWSWRDEFGTEAQWLLELGEKVMAPGADLLWPASTAG
jgi:hypothetical protein